MSIIHGNGDEYETDAMTVGGQKLVIKITEHGFYYLDVTGAGAKPKISEQRFTSLLEVRKARDAYVQNNLGQITKMKMLEENHGPRPKRSEIRKLNAKTED